MYSNYPNNLLDALIKLHKKKSEKLLTDKHSVFVWVSGVLDDWDDICPLFCNIYEITPASM